MPWKLGLSLSFFHIRPDNSNRSESLCEVLYKNKERNNAPRTRMSTRTSGNREMPTDALVAGTRHLAESYGNKLRWSNPMQKNINAKNYQCKSSLGSHLSNILIFITLVNYSTWAIMCSVSATETHELTLHYPTGWRHRDVALAWRAGELHSHRKTVSRDESAFTFKKDISMHTMGL